jgi:hypothetical protein
MALDYQQLSGFRENDMNNLLSYSSVKLELFSKDGLRLKPASGFVVEAGDKHHLITNRHALSGGDFPAREVREPAATPYLLKTSIHNHGRRREQRAPFSWGPWHRINIPLYDDSGAPAWIERRANDTDIVALPIKLNDSVRLIQSLSAFKSKTTETNLDGDYWIRISAIPISTMDTKVDYAPPDPVHVIGYPLGWEPAGPDRSSSAFWRTSWIASEVHEPGMTQGNIFFIDPCALEGMSGSPVVGLKNDQLKLLGVYSDRSVPGVSANAGLVWEAWLIKELIGAP